MKDANFPRVSVIVPTYQREEILCDTLRFLFSQSYPDYELIIVDQSEEHIPQTDKFILENKDKMQYFRIKEVGTSHAKNYGAAKATGSILFFCDDDIVPIDNLLLYHVENYANENIGGVGGRVLVKDDSMSKNPHHVGFVSKAGVFYDNFSLQKRGEIDTVHGCNMSFRRSVFQATGGFDENFAGNAFREESDLSFRIRKKGYKLIFDPRAEVLHLRAKRGGTRSVGRLQWYHELFHNELLFFLKNMPKRYLPLFFLAKWRPILACMFWYGKGRKDYLLAPWKGFLNGFRTYFQGKKKGLYQ